MKDKQINSVGVGSDHVLMAFPDMVAMFYNYLFPCLDTKRRDEAEDSVLHAASNSGHWSSSPGPSPTAGRFHESPLRAPQSPIRSPPIPLRAPLSPYRLTLSPQPSRREPLNLTLSQIYKITQNFSKDLIIGKGAFGLVYKAELPNGQMVAIKRGKRENSGALRAEFSNEVALLTQIEHKNLVQLLGFIDDKNEQLIITEYVPNGTLREHLDAGQRGGILKFSQRLGIAIDIAHGLTYLHNYAEKPIIHRDIKSSNILLTNTLGAKVADFGFARMGPTKDGHSHVSTNIKGTAGYVDPDYLRTFHLSPKSDVFSFGIILLEILSARRPVDIMKPDEKITIRWAFSKYNEGRMSEILDPLMPEKVPDEVLKRILGLAFQCAAPYRRERPNMREVCEKLWKIRKDYNTQCRHIN